MTESLEDRALRIWREMKVEADLDGSFLEGSIVQFAERLMAEQGEPVAWIDGVPPHPYDKEWFIALTIYGDRVVLCALPEEYTYDFKTADDTYMMADKIKCWMQFPDSQFVRYASPPLRTQ